MNPGQTVSHYRILERLGGGGMGVVFKAEDTRLKRTVALKFLPPELTRDPEAKARFVREAQAASGLQHDNICTIHDIDETPEGELFIVMDFYDGETLKSKIARGPLALDEAMEIARQIGLGLAKAHEAGMVHRDVKPANVMVTREGEAKIVDFGLALLAGQTKLTNAGSTTGTASYMSPEQARGDPVDHRTDIWSLGVTLYEMISGRPPFRAEYDTAILYSIVGEEPKPLSSLRTDVPIDLEKIVQKALAKDPRERYQHVDDLLVDIRRVKGETEETMRTVAAPTARRGRPAFARIAALAGIIALGLAGLFVVKPLLEDRMLASNPIPVAVITFENQTGDPAYDYLQEAIPNLLITNLEQSRFLRVATWERLRDLMKQIGKAEERTITSELGIELCRRGGINVIVVGRYTKAGEIFATDVKVMDVDTKEILRSANSKGRGVESILESQIDDLSRDIAQGAGLSERSVVAAPLSVGSVTTHSMDAYHYLLRGKEDYHRFYYQDAKRFLQKAISLDTAFAEAHMFLALTLRALNETDAMDAAIRKAMLYASRSNERSRLHIEAVYAGLVDADVPKSIRLIEEAVSKYPEDKDARMYLGLMYRIGGAYERAALQMEKVLELDPEYPYALNDLGYDYSQLGRYDKALECFQRQIAASPGDANPMDSMAELYFMIGNLEQAIARYREVLELKPDFYTSYMALAYTLALNGQYEAGLESCNRYLSAVPSAGLKAEGHWDRAFLNLVLGRHSAALADLGQVRTFAASAGSGDWRRRADELEGYIRFEQKDYVRSRRLLEAYYANTVAAYPPLYLARIRAGGECVAALIDLREGHVGRARRRLALIDSLLPSVDAVGKPMIQYPRDVLYGEVLMGEDSAAKAVQVLKSTPPPPIPTMNSTDMVRVNVPTTRDALARAYLKLGQRGEAIAEYERIVRFDSARGDHRIPLPKHRFDLGRLYEENMEYAKAREQYVKFLDAWKNADADLPEVIEAKTKLKRLPPQAAPGGS